MKIIVDASTISSVAIAPKAIQAGGSVKFHAIVLGIRGPQRPSQCRALFSRIALPMGADPIDFAFINHGHRERN